MNTFFTGYFEISLSTTHNPPTKIIDLIGLTIIGKKNGAHYDQNTTIIKLKLCTDKYNQIV